MRLIDADKIDFKPIRLFNHDEHTYEINGMALFKDVEKIQTIKAIPIDDIKWAIEEIQELRGCTCSCSDGIIDDVEEILYKLIESEGE